LLINEIPASAGMTRILKFLPLTSIKGHNKVIYVLGNLLTNILPRVSNLLLCHEKITKIGGKNVGFNS